MYYYFQEKSVLMNFLVVLQVVNHNFSRGQSMSTFLNYIWILSKYHNIMKTKALQKPSRTKARQKLDKSCIKAGKNRKKQDESRIKVD